MKDKRLLKINIPRKAFNNSYLSLLNDTSRYLILHGGAGSGKSMFIAQRYIFKILKNSLCNILTVRAVGNTNRDSTFAVFKQVIIRWELSKFFKIYESDLRIKCLLNGNMILFKGLDDSEKLKSITFENGELTDIWMEEASEIHEDDFNQLDVRLRGKGSSKQIVISFNPVDINHWLKKRFVDNKSENIKVHHSTYKDNEFLDDEYKNLLESYKTTDRYYYDVYCMGNWGVLGKTIFNAEKISERLNKLTTAAKTGYFEYKESPDELYDIIWRDDCNGCIRIFKEPEKKSYYVIGADTAGDGSDNFAAQVLDNSTGIQSAVLCQRFDEDLFAKQIYCLGKYYNTALVGIEANFSSYPIKELERLNYPKQYVRQTEDEYTHRLMTKYGFKTTSITRPLIISELIKTVRDNYYLINDKQTLEEMLTFVRNEKGRPEAMNNAHDDLVIALAIAYYIRPQQEFKIISEKPADTFWEEDMWEDYLNAEEEEREMIIKLWGKP